MGKALYLKALTGRWQLDAHAVPVTVPREASLTVTGPVCPAGPAEAIELDADLEAVITVPIKLRCLFVKYKLAGVSLPARSQIRALASLFCMKCTRQGAARDQEQAKGRPAHRGGVSSQ